MYETDEGMFTTGIAYGRRKSTINRPFRQSLKTENDDDD